MWGGAGCGKSHLIRHACARIGILDPIELCLDDSSDMKALVGSYACSDVPGEFIWLDGPLLQVHGPYYAYSYQQLKIYCDIVQGMKSGSWLIVEDIDTSPVELLTFLAAVARSGQLTVPGAATVVKAAPSFRLIGTMSKDSIAPGPLADELRTWAKVRVPVLDAIHLKQLVDEYVVPSVR